MATTPLTDTDRLKWLATNLVSWCPGLGSVVVGFLDVNGHSCVRTLTLPDELKDGNLSEDRDIAIMRWGVDHLMTVKAGEPETVS